MNISKIAASIAFATLVLSAGSAMASSTPHSPSFQQSQCAIEGGSFSLGEHDSYLCDLPDGSEQTCTFVGGPVCFTKDGAPVNRGPHHTQIIKFI